MREWVTVDANREAEWGDLAEDALSFVSRA